MMPRDLITLNTSAQDAALAPDQKIVLSERDFARLTEALKNPAPISTRLEAAAENYKMVRRAHPELKW
jgi:uncharacterized protein (DUF1778 family)